VPSERSRLFQLALVCSVLSVGFWIARIAVGGSTVVTVGAVVFTVATLVLGFASERGHS